MSIKEVRTRFAPSPTGFLHIGGVRTALYNYLFAKKNNGKFILRIEDTDIERSSGDYVEVILCGLKWVGLEWDEGPFFQSKRQDFYRDALQNLINEDKVYRCYCSAEELKAKREEAIKNKTPPGYDGRCRNLSAAEREDYQKSSRGYAYRIKIPHSGKIIFNDIIKGTIEVDASIIKDFIIVRSDGMPTYNFACVVDDACMRISHVIRGDDHISNTPKQLLLYEALGKKPPEFAHLPQVHGKDGKRLSKRTGAISLEEYKKMGYLPEALRNYLALLGWSTDDSQQLFKWEELKEKFDLSRCGTSAGIFDVEKLNWMNGVYIRNFTGSEIAQKAIPWLMKSSLIKDDKISAEVIGAIKLERDKIKLLSEIPSLIDFMICDSIKYDDKAVRKRLKKEGAGEILAAILDDIEKLEDFTAENIEKLFRKFCEEKNLSASKVFHPVRVAVSGVMTGPGLFELLEFIGKERTVKRMRYAIESFTGMRSVKKNDNSAKRKKNDNSLSFFSEA